jgi:hypothetical protein
LMNSILDLIPVHKLLSSAVFPSAWKSIGFGY